MLDAFLAGVDFPASAVDYFAAAHFAACYQRRDLTMLGLGGFLLRYIGSR